MNDTAGDIRFAFRSFRHNPAFAVATILVLGIGVGAVSLMFSTYNTVVLRPLPYPDPDRLVWIWATTPNGSHNTISYDDYVDYRDHAGAFEHLGAFMVFSRRRLLSGGDNPQQVIGYEVSSNLFATLGVSPALGRSFLPEEERQGEAGVVILSHGLWTSRYGADAAIVGQTIHLDGRAVKVVGVMPSDFDYPAGADIWFPLQQSAGYASGRGNNNFYSIGRLREGLSLEQAQSRMAMVAAGIAADYPNTKAGWDVELESLHERYFGPAGSSILLLMGIIVLVPLVACANVASLFLARAVTRRAEIAARLTLGATRGRLVRQLLTENLLLALGGGAVGLALAYGGGEALRHFAPAALPRLEAIGLDANVVVFTVAAALFTVPLFGIIPALRTTDVNIAETLKSGGRASSGRRLRGVSVLVVAQVAFSLVLMLAAGLLLRGYLSLQARGPGFQTRNVLYCRVTLPSFKYETEEKVRAAWEDLHRRLGAVPGVLAVGAVDRVPLGGRGPWNEVWASQRPPASAADKEGATRRFVSDGFFGAMGISVLSGRVFGREDEQAGVPVVVINQTLARQFFPGENPVGQRLILDSGRPVELAVIGLVADVREAGPGVEAPPIFYLPQRLASPLDMYLVVRTQGAVSGIADAWRAAVRAVDPDIPAVSIRTIEDRLSVSLFQPRFRSALVAVFAFVSLILAAVGLYSVLAYFMREHMHELGVRMALGATGGEAARIVLVRGTSLVIAGILIGLAGGILGARVIWLRGWLPGLDPYDPMTYAGVVLSLSIAAFAACVLPALRALRIDPARVMRVE